MQQSRQTMAVITCALMRPALILRNVLFAGRL